MIKENIDKINSLIDEKLYDNALKFAKELLKENDQDEEIYYYIGNIYSSLEEYNKSIEYYDKTIKLNPKYEKAYNNRALSKNAIFEYDGALEDIKKLFELDTDKEYLYMYYDNLGLIKSNIGEHDDAIANFNKSIELNNKYDNVYNNRGCTYLLLKKYDEAIKDFNKVILLDDQYEEAYYYKALNYYALDNYKESLYNFSMLSKLNDNFSASNLLNIITKYFKLNYNSILNIINLLLEDNSYIDIWKRDITLSIINKETENIDNYILKNIKEVLLFEYLLISLLSFKSELLYDHYENEVSIVHYTSLEILFSLLDDNKNKLRITSITTANDINEGKILENIFYNNNVNIKIENNNEYNLIPFQTSFSRNKDSLTMFRLYGKDKNIESTGVCLVLDESYFDDDPFGDIIPVKMNSQYLDLENSYIDNENKENYYNKNSLYWILYYNEDKNQLVFNPTNSKYKSIIINLENVYKAELKEKEKNIEIVIKFIFKKIFEASNNINKVEKDEIKNIIFSYLFENIRYLIKHEAFFEEQELRIISINNIESKDIKRDLKTKRLYIDYCKLFDKNENYIKEIILGSKVSNVQSVAEYISKILLEKENNKLKSTKITVSKAPLR
ncbi:tetratricopeptide repeat protein [Brachyspira intermedia]|uniref:tetratricopeptide repeat protein n=1 Tax=Brachyspira intermedia TaxID=84377 RepID=UPI0030079FCB